MLKIRSGLAIPLDEIAFSADTSGGKGGQHANRSSTRVELRFDVLGSPSLSARQRALIAEKLGPRIGRDGTLRVVSAAERSQLRNRRAAHADEADARLEDRARRDQEAPRHREGRAQAPGRRRLNLPPEVPCPIRLPACRP